MLPLAAIGHEPPSYVNLVTAPRATDEATAPRSSTSSSSTAAARRCAARRTRRPSTASAAAPASTRAPCGGGRRPGLRLALLGPDRRGADAAARGHARASARRAAVPLLALRRLPRGLPGRDPAARPAGARAPRRSGPARRAPPSAPHGGPGRSPGRARAATARLRGQPRSGACSRASCRLPPPGSARTTRCPKSTPVRSMRAGPSSSGTGVIEQFLGPSPPGAASRAACRPPGRAQHGRGAARGVRGADGLPLGGRRARRRARPREPGRPGRARARRCRHHRGRAGHRGDRHAGADLRRGTGPRRRAAARRPHHRCSRPTGSSPTSDGARTRLRGRRATACGDHRS